MIKNLNYFWAREIQNFTIILFMRISVFLFSKNPLNSLINSDLERALVWLQHEIQPAGAQHQ